MKRRKLFKTLGLASAGLVAGGALLSSKSTSAQEKQDKLIVNRQKMTFADPNHPSKHELKHTPDISFHEKDPNGFTKVKITIGQQGIIHPTTPEHWIDYLSIYKNNELVSHTEFENGPIRGYGEHFLNLKDGDIIKAESGCNLHGIWESEKKFS